MFLFRCLLLSSAFLSLPHTGPWCLNSVALPFKEEWHCAFCWYSLTLCGFGFSMVWNICYRPSYGVKCWNGLDIGLLTIVSRDHSKLGNWKLKAVKFWRHCAQRDRAVFIIFFQLSLTIFIIKHLTVDTHFDRVTKYWEYFVLTVLPEMREPHYLKWKRITLSACSPLRMSYIIKESAQLFILCNFFWSNSP